MFNKTYIKELFKKQTLMEWIIISVFFTGMLLFSICDINNGLVVSSQWKNGTQGAIGQFFILLASFAATITIMNRMHRFKQELPFLLVGALFTGLGLIMQGYQLWSTYPDAGASTMAPGLIQLFVFGMSALAGFASFRNHTENVVPAQRKFWSKDLMIGLTVILITIYPFYLIFDKLIAGNSQTSGVAIDYIEWIGIIGFSFSTGAIVMMVIFRWTWTFIFWTIANISFVIYYLLVKTQHDIPLLSLVIISGLFTVADFYILLRWLKDQKHEHIKN